MATVQSLPTPAHELQLQQDEQAQAAQLPRLRGNYGSYIDSDSTGWMKPTPRDTSIEEMRRRFDEDGYVWVKNVIPREEVLDMRESYFKHLEPTGILAPGTSPREGIFNTALDPLDHHGVGGRDLPDSDTQVSLLESAHYHPDYLSFLENESLRSFIREFKDWSKEVMLKRTMLRHNVPHGLSTGIHYDQIFLRCSADEFLTGWVPIGDCAANGGGLMYLEHSTALGKAMEADFMRRAQHMPESERLSGFNMNMARDGQLTHDPASFGNEEPGKFGLGGEDGKMRWLVGDYEAGDVVFHNPYLIHGSAKNEDQKGRIRLSTDLRFYEEGAKLDERWMRSIWYATDGL